MNEIDIFLQPFALWLGLGLIKAGILMIVAWVVIIAWRGTTDDNNWGD